MDKKKMIAYAMMIVSVALLLVITLSENEKEPASGFEAYRIVAHAMGGINGHTYTNTLDAFVANYEQGTRVFEVDLLQTADQKLVARHEWTAHMSELLGQLQVLPAAKQGEVLNYAEFMDTPILELYTPLDIDKIMSLLAAYPDAYLVTDTKELEPEIVTRQFQSIVNAANRKNPALLQRIVPQIYNREMYGVVQAVYKFPRIIYTLYQSKDSDEQVIDFVKASGVDITMPLSRTDKTFIRKLKKAGARTYVHTVNDGAEITKQYRMGVDGFYTDFVSEDDIRQMKGVGN
ncbi:phosphatidylinositol-specific phospholipase C/glycerophosphodiester phosphodiesterase family protein [Paenibacillus sp. NFR01]|uniref:phosphatidylinositol-specific phospholipase C/glycerophosphodiester phosphodiesterase family protein n=1 Tax=Paenibacillus sp. NFR01 TaxID=1566279 RepID=UPI0008B5CDB6|nr:phosphatidylinositol-specific phospholipase C/glycerophosphodiester phosphodiesterase family protein [Paenibacillus sp. NFR01]SEU15517.1 glycerophosphoryl diester phosphodiesterase [Paenibacillus sp. NFR01]